MKKRKLYGQYIVADPAICHGKLTFTGTRIMVRQILDQLARGMEWDEIVRRWGGEVTREAIQEAVELTHRALLDHLEEYALEPEPA